MSLVTNKIRKSEPLEATVGNNAKALEEMLRKVNWKYILGVYFLGLLTLVFSIFLLIVIIRFAFIIF